MKTHAFRTLSLAAALAVTSAAVTVPAGADDWKWSLTPYAWATDVGVDVTLDDREWIDAEIAFEDLLEDLDTVAQVHLEGQRGKHGFLVDLFDVQLSDEGTFALPGGGDALLDSVVGMTLLEAAGIYDPRGDGQGIEFLYGTRLLQQRAELDARLESTARSYDARDTLVDGLFGVRYLQPFSPRWGGIFRADASAGGTEFTWSSGAAVAYSFGCEGRYALTAGYRHMVVDFDTEDSLDADMTLKGPFVGLRLTF